MISSHNRVFSMLFSVLFAASSPAIAGETGAGKNPADSTRPTLSSASKNAPASPISTTPPSAVIAKTPASPVVITTDRLFIKASRQMQASKPVVITIEPLVIQAVAQK